MVAFHASALDGVARNPALPTPLLLRLLAFDGGGDGRPRHALQRAGLPEPAIAVILAHPNPGTRIDFAMSARAEPAQRARLTDDPSPKVRAALAYGPEWRDPRTTVAPLPNDVCARLLGDPDPSGVAVVMAAKTTDIADLGRCRSEWRGVRVARTGGELAECWAPRRR
ncbi:hypothetical protein ACWD4K_17445 [Streptomyces gelaticus]